MADQIRIKDLFDLTGTQMEAYLSQFEYPWEALSGIGEAILACGKMLPEAEYDHPEEDIWIAKSAKIAKLATITGPCIIGPETEVRPGAFIRGNAWVGDHCVVGNSTELKNVILVSHVQAPHYNYVGDSIFGKGSHTGAGAITSNVKGDKKPVVIHGEIDYETGRKKIGAFLGDGAEVGCNTVMNPGSILGKNVQVYPLSMVRGVIKANSIYKKQGEIAEKH